MNNEFKVLWFDDNLEWYTEALEDLKDFIFSSYGLKLTSDNYKGDDFDITLLKDSTYDLALVDYDLGMGILGSKIIEMIRKNDAYVDILFYSSHYMRLREEMNRTDPPMQGVYHCNRDNGNFDHNVRSLSSKIVNRSENITNLCGTVVEKCSDYENKMSEIINRIWENSSDSVKLEIINDTKEIINSMMSGYNSNYNDAVNNDYLPFVLNKNKGFFSSICRLKLIEKLVNNVLLGDGFNPTKEQKSIKHFYENEISKYRNSLSHENPCSKTIKIDGKEKEINADLHCFIRKNLTKYDDTFETILVYVNEKQKKGLFDEYLKNGS